MKRILVTDDNSDYRHNIMELLRIEGYEVLDADNGLTAVQLAKTEAPDLILCDIDMPVMNGFEVLAMLKTDPTASSIPFIIVSGRSDAPSIEKVRHLGAADYMIKPMDIDILLDKLRKYLPDKPE